MPPSGTAMTTNSVPRTTRADYHKEALQTIRESLLPFETVLCTVPALPVLPALPAPRERLSPVVGGDAGPTVPPTPPRPPHLLHHHQPPSPHHLQNLQQQQPKLCGSYDGGSIGANSSIASSNTSNGSGSMSQQFQYQYHHLPPHLSSHTGPPPSAPSSRSSTASVEYPPPPPPPPRVPPHPPPSSPPPTAAPTSQMPPILSRLSPGPVKCKVPTPNYVNISSSGLGPGRPMTVPHGAGPAQLGAMGPPPPYPTQGKPMKVSPPPYSSRQSPCVDRTSPAVPHGSTPPPLTVGNSLGAGAMAPIVSIHQHLHPHHQYSQHSHHQYHHQFHHHQQQQQQHQQLYQQQQQQQQHQQQQPSCGQTARQAKTPTPVIMQSVRSTQVQKPVLQTAVAPPSPPLTTPTTQQQQLMFCVTAAAGPQLSQSAASLSSSSSTSTLTPCATASPPPPPYSSASSTSCSPYPPLPTPSASPYTLPPSPYTIPPASSPYTITSSSPYTIASASSSSSPSPVTPPVTMMGESPVPLFDPPSYHSTMQAKAAAARVSNPAAGNCCYSSHYNTNGFYSSSCYNSNVIGNNCSNNVNSNSNNNNSISNVNSRAAYRGCNSPALASIPVQEILVQELDLSSTPLAHIPIDTVSDTGNSNLNSSNYNDCDSGVVTAPTNARLNRVLAAGGVGLGGGASPRSASPVSSVMSHDTHGLSPSPVSCLSTATSSPSTQSDMTLESGYSSSSQSAAARGRLAPPPPPPNSNNPTSISNSNVSSNINNSKGPCLGGNANSAMPPPPLPPPHQHKTMHHSPIPERKKKTPLDLDLSHPDTKVKYTPPEAYKFYMEQHVENVIKMAEQRKQRGMQLEQDMTKVGLSTEDKREMRKVLCQKESNFIRLQRAKMNKSMFHTIKTIGVGAFGEVALVRKNDGSKLYAMKTLRKSDVLKRNQVAHVKAERDILAESDNDWVVKLYYSFQDADNLYLIMDYIPGGDLMSLLIKFGIFKEPLARFYIAELVCAIESVHKMGFIHRDIKPDNILIDRDGHIKLTDFGLCTGFRWTHNSRYYQRKGDHARQESMDPCGDNDLVCRCNDLKPLERRRRRQHLRCLAHSLVGTPNYIAPEVLARTGYSQLCDWWSVGVILYEMLVGQPPFLANSPADTQYKVLNWKTTLHIPKQANMSPEARDLIQRLCTGPETRLGHNAQEIKNHPFFSEIDFDAGLRKQQALYIPEIKHDTDTSNFDPIEPDRLRSDADSDGDWVNSSQPIHGFFEFTFRRFFDSTPTSGGGPVGAGGARGNGGGGSMGATGSSSDEKDGQHPVYV